MIPSYVFFCPACDMWSTGQTQDITKYYFKCQYCKYSKRLHFRAESHVIFKGPFDSIEASKICKEINMMKSRQDSDEKNGNKKNKENDTGFRTALSL